MNQILVEIFLFFYDLFLRFLCELLFRAQIFFSFRKKLKKMDDNWVQLRHDVCALLNVAHFRQITFVWATKRQSTDPAVRQEVIDTGVPVLHPDGRPVSICTRYLWWGGSDDTALDPHLIDIWQQGPDLYLFLSEGNDGHSRSAEDFSPNPIVRIQFPARSEWLSSRRRELEAQGYRADDIRLILTDDEYARAIRQQVHEQYPDLVTPLERFAEFTRRRAGILERYDPLELYKEYLRNSIRRDMKRHIESKASHEEAPTVLPDVTVGPAREPTLRELNLLGSDDAVVHASGQKRDGTSFWIGVEGRDSMQSFKQKVSNATGIPVPSLAFLVAGRRANEPAQLFANLQDVRFLVLDEDEQRRIAGLVSPVGPAREPTLRELNLLGSDDFVVHARGSTKDARSFFIEVEGRDSMQSFKQKVSNATRIPVASLILLANGRRVTELAQLFSNLRDVRFWVLDEEDEQRRTAGLAREPAREPTLRDLNVLDADDAVIRASGKTRDGNSFFIAVEGRDSMQSFKQKVSNATGIPVASLIFLANGRRVTEPVQLFANKQDARFWVLDSRT